MNKSELEITNLKKALATLKESMSRYETNQDPGMTDIILDSCIKRFEYTMETSWKIMKKYLILEYAVDSKELTMNNIFRLMEGYGLIPSWERWKVSYAKRNDTSHEYNIEKSRELVKIIPDFIKDVDILIDNLDKALGESPES